MYVQSSITDMVLVFVQPTWFNFRKNKLRVKEETKCGALKICYMRRKFAKTVM